MASSALLTKVSAEIEEISKRYKLQYWQVEYAKNLAKPKALRQSTVDMAKQLGVPEKSLNYWKNHPVITKIRMELTRLHFFNDVPDVMMAVKDNALRGDTRAAQLFFEMVLELKLHDEQNLPAPPNTGAGEVAIYLIQIRKKHNIPISAELQAAADKYENIKKKKNA